MRIYIHGGKYCTDEPQPCKFCGEMQTEAFFYAEFWEKKKDVQNFAYCSGCRDSIKAKSSIGIFRIVAVLDHLPKGARKVSKSFPGLVQRGDLTVWSGALEKDGAKIEDYTRLAGRESIKGAQVGAKIEKKKELPGK